MLLDFVTALFKFHSPVDWTLLWAELGVFLWPEGLGMGKTLKISLCSGEQSPVFQAVVNFFVLQESFQLSNLSFCSAPPFWNCSTLGKSSCSTSTRHGCDLPVDYWLSFSVPGVFTELKWFLSLSASEPIQMQTGICSHESKGVLFQERAPPLESQVSLCSETWLPSGFQGMGCIGKYH